ncbi:Transcription factor spt20 [Malassezia caprae]|uniref:Transcription factor spt20 n=1 Tax=Malassezia caprae TaxID=1381934 RepID=A0AAF0E4W3_9BASI|nr:Transcription factor spt20 [Malassezia caprae]
MQDFLHHLCNQIIPVDLMDVFQQAGVPFFEGCLIVEVHDHRKRTTATDPHLSQYKADGRRERPRDTSLYYLREGGRYGFHYTRYGGHSHPSNEDTALGPDGVEVYRIVLRPSEESLWNDLRMMDARAGGLWSDEDALAVEAQIVNLTAPPLCLTPDPHVTRIANLMLSSTVPPSFHIGSVSSENYQSHPDTGDRLNSIEREQAKSKDVRREQVMQIMKDGWKSGSVHSSHDGTHHDASFMPSFSRLDFLRNWRKGHSQNNEVSSTPVPSNSDAARNDAKKLTSAKKKRAKEPEDTKSTPPSTTGSTAADSKTKTKRRKKDGSPISVTEEKKQRRTAGASSMSPSSHGARGSPSMAGKMEGLVLPGSKPANAMLPGYQSSPPMGAGLGVNPLAPGMSQNTSSSPFVPPGSQPSNINAGSWFMPS